MRFLKRADGGIWFLVLVASVSPALAFLDPPYWQTVEPLPREIDRPLYCAEVMMNAAGAREGEGVRPFQMRIAAADLLSAYGYELMDKAGWNVDDRALRYTAGIMPEVEAHWEARTLRYSEADCLALARSFEKLEAPAEGDVLITCAELLYVRSEEYAAAGDEAARGSAHTASIALSAKALDRLQADGLTFSEALDIV